MEERVVLSHSAGALFSRLGPYYVDQTHPPGQGGFAPAVSAVGHYSSGGSVRPFVAVTYGNEVGGVFVFLSDDRGGLASPPTRIDIGDDRHHVGSEGIIVGHFTNPGVDDLVVASDGDFTTSNPGSVVLIRGDGFGHFPAQEPLPLPSGHLVMPDLLASATIGGLPYLFVSDYSGQPVGDPGSANEVLVYKGDGSGNFALQPPLRDVIKPEMIVARDFNNDGNVDLAVVNAIDKQDLGASTPPHNSVSIFQGDGTGQFQSVANIPVGPNSPPRNRIARPVDMTVGDFNGDGKPDLAVIDGQAPHAISVLRNLSTDRGTISFGSKPDLTIKSQQFGEGIAAVGLGDAFPGLAVSGHKGLFLLHNRSRIGGPIRFRRPARLNLGPASAPGHLLAAKVVGTDPLANDDLIVINSQTDNIMVLKNNTVHA
jgi:hypothetical protein